jgi:hypothetical protein
MESLQKTKHFGAEVNNCPNTLILNNKVIHLHNLIKP